MAIDKAIAIRNGVIVTVLLLLGGWLVYEWKPEWFTGAPPEQPPPPVESEAPPQPPDPADGEADVADTARSQWIEITGTDPPPAADEPAPDECESIDRAWRTTCAHLDARFLIDDSYTTSLELIPRLSGTPPTVSGELLRHGAMLENVFLLFRAVGAERMSYLSRMLEEEELLEPASHSFYRWVSTSERCASEAGVSVPVGVLADYGAYLFQTLGGQAYLRRRAPRAEALACYYAIRSIDLAQQSGANSQGYDPRREIPRCRELLAAQEWALGDRYVETLDGIEADWAIR